MVFSSLVFIWYFLPAVFFVYLLMPGLKTKNLILLLASLLFYAWGEPEYVVLLLVSVMLNYMFGILIERQERQTIRRMMVALCLAVNLGLLCYFKYYNFFAIMFNGMIRKGIIQLRDIALPIGISFYTFQALSYVLDVYRGKIKAQKNIFNLALYISFFPQLIAGPIVKYHDIENQLTSRTASASRMAYGVRRFCFGLGKKVILANTFASVVDYCLGNAEYGQMSTSLVWLIILLYTLQIYYDFSGYSDMAIGLGKIFGFDFMENFNYPYLSQSIREFWRRWHISLSTWFREYLYIPLGGNRKGAVRTYINLFIVFLVTGLWHGAGINFVWWGIYHGIFIIIERLFLGKVLEKNPIKLLNHIYAMFVVVVGWMVFRIENPEQIIGTLGAMFKFQKGAYTIPMFTDARVWFWVAVGLLLCGPLQAMCKPLRVHLYDEESINVWDIIVMVVLLCFSTLLLVNNTYNPFIYFRF